MTCPSVLTGERFLIRAIEHIDCQTRELGSFGYLALGEPGSTASIVMASVLTLFIALFGFRLLFGPQPGTRDIVMDVITIGLVLTLAFSWPAFRTLIHDVVLDGPAELAATITPATLTDGNTDFSSRLQGVNDAMAQLTAFGTGRNVGQLVDDSVGASFQGTAVEDNAGLGYGRTIWLGGVIGLLLPLRFLGGLLLALAPLAAVLLLFDATRGLFSGWLRGLILTLIGTLGVTLMLALELAVLEPYLADALRLRQTGYAVPSAPTELLALSLGFLVAKLVLIALLARVAFQRGWLRTNVSHQDVPQAEATPRTEPRAQAAVTSITTPPRAQVIARSIETRMSFEETGGFTAGRVPAPREISNGSGPVASTSQMPIGSTGRLGQSGRRAARRVSVSANRRDAR